jgi:hypothetical protein
MKRFKTGRLIETHCSTTVSRFYRRIPVPCWWEIIPRGDGPKRAPAMIGPLNISRRPLKASNRSPSGMATVPLGSCQSLTGVGLCPGSHERVKSDTTPSAHAADQLKRVCPRLCVRPVALYDSEYGRGTFLTHTQDIACDLRF